MNTKLPILILLLVATSFAYSAPVKKDFYQIKLYHLKSNEQVSMMDGYLKDVYLPAMHRAGVKNIGVFKPIANDTAAAKLIYVFIPFSSSTSWMDIDAKLEKDGVYKDAAKSFNEAPSDNSPYERMESILLEAFPGQPHLVLPKDKNTERVFELRSYESPTASLHKKKMDMFNTGGEIEI
ncbi:MAG: NIPSNAP family containing protein, partial [Ginsengibacter sp.]